MIFTVLSFLWSNRINVVIVAIAAIMVYGYFRINSMANTIDVLNGTVTTQKTVIDTMSKQFEDNKELLSKYSNDLATIHATTAQNTAKIGAITKKSTDPATATEINAMVNELTRRVEEASKK